jgi:hypothetical protein
LPNIADVCTDSGIVYSCEYIAQSLGEYKLAENCVCLCDDDNDMEMADACEHAYLPTISSSTMLERVTKSANHEHYTCTETEVVRETAATEAALDIVLQRLGVTDAVE